MKIKNFPAESENFSFVGILPRVDFLLKAVIKEAQKRTLIKQAQVVLFIVCTFLSFACINRLIRKDSIFSLTACWNHLIKFAFCLCKQTEKIHTRCRCASCLQWGKKFNVRRCTADYDFLTVTLNSNCLLSFFVSKQLLR